MGRTTKQIIIILIAVIIIFLIINSKIGFFESEEAAANNTGTPGNSAISAAAVVVEPSQLNNRIKVTGTLMANESVKLTSEISGKISGIYFQEGDNVQKGDLLVSINDDELKAQLEKLKYTRKLNEDNEYRQRQLLVKEAISQEEYEIALTELNTAEADIKLLEAQIEKAHIRAPFDGTIGLRQVSEGSYISPNTVIANFFSIDPIKIEFSVPGKYSRQIRTGQNIRFTIESLNDSYQGDIYAIEPQIDPATRTLMVRAISSNKGRELLPGQFANIELTLQTVDNALLVPSVSVIPELDGHRLFVFKEGIAKSVNVTIGSRTDQEVQIINGISQQDTVLTTGILQLRDGVPVNITQLN